MDINNTSKASFWRRSLDCFSKLRLPNRKELKSAFFSIYSYTIIYAFFGVLSLSYHACFNSSQSTLEKRYHFSSTTSGYIMTTDNIATLITNLFIGYYGKTAHKPRWMAFGCIVTGLSVMITAVPYFIYGPAQEAELQVVGNMTLSIKSRNGDQMCLSSEQKEDCSDITASGERMMTIVAVSCFAISNFFRGFGTSIYFTYGTPYLDDNVDKAVMPTFFAFIFAARICGAPIGYFLSSRALAYYEDPFAVPAGLTKEDPRWIGAWWIGFLVSGALMLMLAFPLSLFPREFKKKTRATANMPEQLQLMTVDKQVVDAQTNGNGSGDLTVTTTNHLSERMEEVDLKRRSRQNEDDEEDAEPKKAKELSLRDMPKEIWSILSNPIVICQMMGNMFRGIGIIGYFVFQTRYLESQFRQSASKASLVGGTTGFVGKTVGVLFGGLVITLFRPKARQLTTFIFLVEVTSVFTLLYGASVMGPQYTYPNTSIQPNGLMKLDNTCNANCHCDRVRYQPVCEPLAMKSYFSPCHAGCKQSVKNAGEGEGSTYMDCGCVDEHSKSLSKCPPDHSSLMTYATIVAVGGMISGSSRSGNMVTFFRSIKPDQKSMAVAVGSFWHSAFVSIPYPIIYGKIFDWSCLVWSKECDERGNCWLYDTEKLRKVYHGFSIVLIALGSVFDLIMIFLSPRLTELYEPDDRTLKQRLMFWRKHPRPSPKVGEDVEHNSLDVPKKDLLTKSS